MPSDKESLDSLLKEMSDEKVNGESAMENDGQAPDMEALSEMTEDEIARMLSEKSVAVMNRQEAEDVLEMLEDAQGEDLQEIQELLKKSDRNEAIHGDDLEQGHDMEEVDPADQLIADIEGMGEEKVAGNAADKKAQRAMLREQKKKEKADRKAAKIAAKKARASGKGTDLGQEAETSGYEKEELEGADRFDAGVLDSIVSGADQLKREMSSAEAERKIPELLEQDIVAVDPDQIDDLIPDISERRSEPEKKPKQGLMSKALSFLMEEDEEEEEKPAENEDILLSDENQDILRALEGDEPKAAGASKKKKPKKKAKKKEAKPKKAKKPKPRKVKKPREDEPYIPGRRLTFKKMLPVLLLGASVGAALLILVNLSVDFGDKREAERAYTEKRYEVCYQNLFGKDRNEEQERMYVASESILYMRLKMEEYESFVAEGSEVKALDSLIQTINSYPALSAYASQWEAVAEVYDLHGKMVDTLDWKYGISEAQALEIAAVKSDVEYTRIVTALAEGGVYGSWGRPVMAEPEESNEEPEVLPDELPEEEDLDQGEFVDNQ